MHILCRFLKILRRCASARMQLLEALLWTFVKNPVWPALYPCSRQKRRNFFCKLFLLGWILRPNVSRNLLQICSKSTLDWPKDEGLFNFDNIFIHFMKMQMESCPRLGPKYLHKLVLMNLNSYMLNEIKTWLGYKGFWSIGNNYVKILYICILTELAHLADLI